ncbi:hypothetical protein BRC97_01560 [Halobacteriales archaeon QS_6_71_20]|nr:MAG: hypothetical protein BRC97_01560 [Halobacteriales archaeon QS_6_71_20]
MIGAYTVGKRAVKFGYERYGVPGAVASGGAVLAGYLIVRRVLRSPDGGSESGSGSDGEGGSASEE